MRLFVYELIGNYYIFLKMHCMWFSYKKYKSQALSKLKTLFIIGDEIRGFICEKCNLSTKMVCLDHGSGKFYSRYVGV